MIADTDVPHDAESRSAGSVGPSSERSLVRTAQSLLASNWHLLVLGVIIAVLVSGIVLMVTPKRYVAEALVAPTIAQTFVQFGPNATTGPDLPVAAVSAERRQALVDLITSQTVESLVIQQLQGKLSAQELVPGALVQQIKGGTKPRSELISIQAEAASPQAAITLANTWLSAYVAQVNQLYASPASTGDIDSLKGQTDQAFQAHTAAQTALEESLKSSHLEELNSQISDKASQVAILQSDYQNGHFASSSATAQPVDVETARNDYRFAEVRTLNDLAQTLRRVDDAAATAQLLLQGQTDGQGSSTATALTLLRAQLAAIADGLPGQVQLQIPPGSSSGDSIGELRAMVASLQHAREQVASEFQQKTASFETRRQQEMAQLHSDLRALRSAQEAESAQRQRLTLRRDLAWNTYTTLARTLQERTVANVKGQFEVQVASLASSATSKLAALTSILLAAAGGLLLGGVVALRPLWWPRRNAPARRPVVAGAR